MGRHRERLSAYLADATEGRTATILVPLTWPEIKNAEYEVIHRICIAARNIGSRVLVTDNDGYPAWSSDGRQVDRHRRVGRDDADFMISLHFETPRLIDMYSYYAVWQPTEFYFVFGYEASTDKLLTHLDALSCSADHSDAHMRALMQAAGTLPEQAFPYLFHSPPEPYHAPALSRDSRLFYVGINWERLGQAKKGRYHELLMRLEKADLIDIYGPEKLLGQRPWEGYETYRGELPFDGKSVVRAVARSGICLALSSEAHQASGVMSNRMFEGLAAGAAVIANPHPFIDKYLSDVVYQLEDGASDAALFDQISAIIAEVRADPARANEKAQRGQTLMRELFSLEKGLQAIIDLTPARIAAHQARRGPRGEAPFTVVLPYRDTRLQPFTELLASLADQRGVAIRLVVVCRRAFAEELAADVLAAMGKRFEALIVLTEADDEASDIDTSGEALHRALPHIDTPHFAVVGAGESFFVDHFASLVRCLEDGDAVAAVSGLLEEREEENDDGDRLARRTLVDLMPRLTLSGVLAEPASPQPGRFAFRSTVLERSNTALLPLLDGGEIAPFLIEALRDSRMAPTGMATCVRSVPRRRAPSKALREHQQSFLHDAIRFDFELHQMRASATAASAAVTIEVGRTYDTCAGGSGIAFLAGGFSHPEQDYTWIDGDAADIEGTLSSVGDTLGVYLELAGRRNGKILPRCAVLIDDKELTTFEVDEGRALDVFVPIPIHFAKARSRKIRIQLRLIDVPDAVRDPASGAVVDKRRLGVRVVRFGFFRSRAEQRRVTGRPSRNHIRAFAARLRRFLGRYLKR